MNIRMLFVLFCVLGLANFVSAQEEDVPTQEINSNDADTETAANLITNSDGERVWVDVVQTADGSSGSTTGSGADAAADITAEAATAGGDTSEVTVRVVDDGFEVWRSEALVEKVVNDPNSSTGQEGAGWVGELRRDGDQVEFRLSRQGGNVPTICPLKAGTTNVYGPCVVPPSSDSTTS